jgi:hypothetical protein
MSHRKLDRLTQGMTKLICADKRRQVSDNNALLRFESGKPHLRNFVRVLLVVRVEQL